MSGTMHPYYTAALAPGIAALVGAGAVALWRRGTVAARATLALTTAGTAAWSFALLAASTESFAWLRWVVVGLAAVSVPVLFAGRGAGRVARPAVVAAVVAAVLAGLLGTGAYAVATASVAHTGSIPSVGTAASTMGGDGQGDGQGGPGGDGGERPARPDGATGTGATGTDATGTGATGTGATGTDPGGPPSGGGGPGGGASISADGELATLLRGTDGTWSAAVATSSTAASLELASGTAVMSTGGWSGSDPAVTLEQFQAYVADGQISYYVGGQGDGRGGPGGDSAGTSAQIAEWVATTYSATTVDGQTVYDLTA